MTISKDNYKETIAKLYEALMQQHQECFGRSFTTAALVRDVLGEVAFEDEIDLMQIHSGLFDYASTKDTLLRVINPECFIGMPYDIEYGVCTEVKK